jgi:hypothetical protein
VVTPPFPEYVSGHSTFSAAGAKVITTFLGSDNFGASVTVPAGTSRIEPRTPEHPGTPAKDVTLYWPTFSAAANEAGMSRRYGGIHFESGDLHGRSLGRRSAGTPGSRPSPTSGRSTPARSWADPRPRPGTRTGTGKLNMSRTPRGVRVRPSGDGSGQDARGSPFLEVGLGPLGGRMSALYGSQTSSTRRLSQLSMASRSSLSSSLTKR